MARSSSNKKVANSLVAMSSAAVLAVYSAGYVRTRSAANRIAEQAMERTLAREAPADAAPDTNFRSTAPDRPVPKPSPAASPRSGIKLTAPVAPNPDAPSVPMSSGGEGSAASVQTETPAPVPVAALAPAQIAPALEQPAEITPAPPAPAPPPPTVWKDGKYSGWGGSRHGDIQATVVIEGGHIISAEISDCQTRYPCDIIDKLPPQVVKRQSHKVDRVGGATESADAFYYAVFEALKLAK